MVQRQTSTKPTLPYVWELKQTNKQANKKQKERKTEVPLCISFAANALFCQTSFKIFVKQTVKNHTPP